MHERCHGHNVRDALPKAQCCQSSWLSRVLVEWHEQRCAASKSQVKCLVEGTATLPGQEAATFIDLNVQNVCRKSLSVAVSERTRHDIVLRLLQALVGPGYRDFGVNMQ